MPRTEVVVYAGPSAHGLDPALFGADVDLRPPARRDDIDRLVSEREEPGIVVLCDGVFQSVPAVSHAELCRAIDASWQVWGVSSLGAIRAWELRHEGMRGFGYVHDQFGRHEDYTDDEVCLLHFPEAPYFPVSEALVNVRYAVERHRAALGITARAESALFAALRALWFGDRTREVVEAALVEHAEITRQAAQDLFGWLDRNRIKSLDLARLMQERPWLG